MPDERVRLGEVDVDSGLLLVIDASYLEDWDYKPLYEEASSITAERAGGQLDSDGDGLGKGAVFWAGSGDGTYEVWATVRDTGDGGRRVVRVEMDLLDQGQGR